MPQVPRRHWREALASRRSCSAAPRAAPGRRRSLRRRRRGPCANARSSGCRSGRARHAEKRVPSASPG